MRENVGTVLLIALFIAGLLLLVWVSGKRVRTLCRQDCSTSNGEFIRSIDPAYAEKQCICKLNGEVKNIW